MRTAVLLALALASPVRAADPSPRPVTVADADAGRALYLTECSACHGERGDGAGPAAAALDPRPRNFTLGLFKLRTTPSGRPPATADVIRTIEHGMPGSAMPAYGDLSADERRQLAAYVLRLANLLDGPEPDPVAAPGAPPPTTPETVARGKALYHKAGCDSCHGESGRGDGEAGHLKDDAGHPIAPRDFTVGVYRSGRDRTALAYRILTGLDGTPMAEYATDFTSAELFALVDYVLSLATPPDEAPLPDDPVKAGRVAAARAYCTACHKIDDGSGGDVGPDLRFSVRAGDAEAVHAYLRGPRPPARVTPERPWRMPLLPVSDRDLTALTRYLATLR